jgi:AraC family transcriptional regulator of adaptative response / DNA-3-methyladenine glycosylase II
MELDFDRCYRAVDSRDQRFDGCFYTGVRSTGIYCRPSCPATTPKRKNVAFYPSAAAAQRAGLRACRRCRPDAAPGSPDWDVRADVVGRAMRLIGDGVVDRDGVPGLAARLGYTERHLGRLLSAELGAGPLALARAQRAQTARILVESTGLGLAEIAFAAGFGSVRQFNDTIREVYACAPSELRAKRRPSPGPGRTGPATAPTPSGEPRAGSVELRLAYRGPLHAAALLDFLAVRALPGVEECDGQTYRRGLRLPHGTATVALTPGERWVAASLDLTDVRDLAPAVARCRRLLDLDADPVAVDQTLAADPAFAAAVAAEPGIRVPRAVDGFEMAVRAIVGQQVSVTAARTTLSHLLHAQDERAHPRPSGAGPGGARSDAAGPGAAGQGAAGQGAAGQGAAGQGAAGPGGGPVDGVGSGGAAGRLRGFLGPGELLGLPDEAFRMPVARRESLRALAGAVEDGRLDLEPGADPAEAVRRLQEVPGVGPWTAGYVVMRALGDPDVFLPTDLAVRRGAAKLGITDLERHAERWRPWRSYALIRLWRAS